MNSFSNLIVPLLLGLLALWVVIATTAGRSVLFISGPRAATIALLVIGMTACMAGGIGQVAASGRWASLLAIAGYVLGVSILVVAASVFTGWKLPLIACQTQAVAAMGILIAAKYLIGTAGFLFHWL